MKTHGINRLLMVVILMTGCITTYGQRQMEVPGDNFSLEGALELFKKSASPQEFEQMLNNADTKVNNLDLNGDGYIDYMRVIDIEEDNVHAFILQAAISPTESQDIAIITLEKLANGEAVLQITGDADIYGVETIIEPTREVRTYAGTTSTRNVVNVWAWPSVRYVYSPYYTAWISPWGWNYRPHWWHPWRPVVYYDYYSYWYPYARYYSPCFTHRVVYAHHIYRPYRTTSVIVYNNHHEQVTRYRTSRSAQNVRSAQTTDRYGRRQANTSVRYDEKGRIIPGSNQATRTRSTSNTTSRERVSANNRSSSSTQDNYANRSRTSADARVRSNDAQEKPTSMRRSTSSNSGARTTNGSTVTPKRESTTSNINRSRTSSGTSSSRYERPTTTTPSSSRTYGSSSGSKQRSSAPANVQRSSTRPSSSSNVRKSPTSGIQRSSSGSASRVQRSTGNSSAQRSSGNISRSPSPSRSSSVQRSSGSSGSVQKSSGNTSRSSSPSRSSSSSSQSRGRR